MKKVTIVQNIVPHYRLPFFEKLKTALEKENVALSLQYGEPYGDDKLKQDTVPIKWGEVFKTYKITPFLVYQSCLAKIIDSDLIILEQANKYLLNYLLQVLRPFRTYKLAFWGHGYCHQYSNNTYRNIIKNYFSVKCDWFFSYTQSTTNYMIKQGYSKSKITTVNNSIDIQQNVELIKNISENHKKYIRKKLYLNEGPVGLFCGGLYKEKELPFLLNAIKKVHTLVPNFNMIFIGSGPSKSIVEEAAARHLWIHYVGNKFDLEKAEIFSISDIFLMPGLVGLAVLDSFSFQVPMVTTNYPYHSPEICYLNKTNSVMTSFNEDIYAESVSQLIKDPSRLKQLKKKCSLSAKKYSINSMVYNFEKGIMKCLS